MKCMKCGRVAQPNDGHKWMTDCGCQDAAIVANLCDDPITEYEKFVAACIVDIKILSHSRLRLERIKLVEGILKTSRGVF